MCRSLRSPRAAAAATTAPPPLSPTLPVLLQVTHSQCGSQPSPHLRPPAASRRGGRLRGGQRWRPGQHRRQWQRLLQLFSITQSCSSTQSLAFTLSTSRRRWVGQGRDNTCCVIRLQAPSWVPCFPCLLLWRAFPCSGCLPPAPRWLFWPQIRAEVERLGVEEGFVNVLSRHTTTAGRFSWPAGCRRRMGAGWLPAVARCNQLAFSLLSHCTVTINECEPRLLDDIRQARLLCAAACSRLCAAM